MAIRYVEYKVVDSAGNVLLTNFCPTFLISGLNDMYYNFSDEPVTVIVKFGNKEILLAMPGKNCSD